jgi:hypothetical protein
MVERKIRLTLASMMKDSAILTLKSNIKKTRPHSHTEEQYRKDDSLGIYYCTLSRREK